MKAAVALVAAIDCAAGVTAEAALPAAGAGCAPGGRRVRYRVPLLLTAAAAAAGALAVLLLLGRWRLKVPPSGCDPASPLEPLRGVRRKRDPFEAARGGGAAVAARVSPWDIARWRRRGGAARSDLRRRWLLGVPAGDG